MELGSDDRIIILEDRRILMGGKWIDISSGSVGICKGKLADDHYLAAFDIGKNSHIHISIRYNNICQV